MRGCFPMCRVRVFCFCFCHPGHMLAPSKNFCGDLYPRILFPHAFAFSPSHSLETLEVMCSHAVTLGHQTIQGGTWGAARKSQAPWTHSPSTLEKHVSPPRHKSGEARSPWRPLPSIDNTDFLLEGREICASQHCLETCLPMVQDTFH